MRVFKEPHEWAKGLIGFTPEQAKDGALFCMDKTAPWPVTMQGVEFPLDVYWLSESGMVVECAELFPGMPVYYPDASGKYVLELPMQEHPRYKIGDFVEVP